MIWPGDDADVTGLGVSTAELPRFSPQEPVEDLVPRFADVCASPMSPHLFALLNENAAWTNELEAAGWASFTSTARHLATFGVMCVKEGTPDLEKVAGGSGTATTEVGELTLSWGRAGDHVAAYWLDEYELVTLTGASTDSVVEAAQEWLDAEKSNGNVEAPQSIPDLAEMPPALDVGPPVDGVPEGYQVLVMDALAFMGSDFVDAITIHEEKGIKALGAALVISDDGQLVGTLVAGRGYGRGLGRWPQQVQGVKAGGLGDVAADGFTAAGVDALIVGYDPEELDAFTSAWEGALSK